MTSKNKNKSINQLINIEESNYIGKLHEWHQSNGFASPIVEFTRPIQRRKGWTQCIFDKNHFMRMETTLAHYRKCRLRFALIFDFDFDFFLNI